MRFALSAQRQDETLTSKERHPSAARCGAPARACRRAHPGGHRRPPVHARTIVDPLPAPVLQGHLYVNDNTAPANTIAGFDRHADGTLTPIAGSPFATGGAGTGAVIGSQGALQMTAGGRALLAVDPGKQRRR